MEPVGQGTLGQQVNLLDSTPLRNSVEDSHQTVVCFLGVIKSSPSGIHSGAGGIIHLGLVVVLGVRHLIILDIFFPTDT